MADPAVVTVMRQFQAQLAARETLQVAQMVRAWLQVEDRLQGDIDALASEFAAEKAAGRAISQAKLYRMARYQTLLGQLREQVSQYTVYADDSITAEQMVMAGFGIDHAAQAIQAASVGVTASFDQLPISAVENMVGLAGNGSPLKTLLANAYPDAVQGMTTALIRGTALGWHPTKTARAMRAGTEMGLQRSLTIARTEQLRVLRASSDAQYQASGVVRAKKRLAAHQTRTCMACLAEDGKIMKLDEPFYDHPAGRCTAVPVLVNIRTPQWQSGKDWFAQQDEATQREMMGTKRFEAWRDGAFKFEDLAKITSDPTWGKSLGVKPLGELAA